MALDLLFDLLSVFEELLFSSSEESSESGSAASPESADSIEASESEESLSGGKYYIGIVN
jgi:hypothetical protein